MTRDLREKAQEGKLEDARRTHAQSEERSHTAKEPTSATSGIAHAAASGVESAVTHVASGVKDALHEATDKVASTYHAGSEYVERRASELGARAEHALEAGARKVRRAERVTTNFVSAHRVPLMLIGAGLGLMTFRAYNQRKRRTPRRRPEPAPVVTAPTLTVGHVAPDLIPTPGGLTVGASVREVQFIDTDSTI